MAKATSIGDSFIDLDTDAEGRATFKFIKELDKRADAFKRMFTYAVATDLLDLVKSKIPSTGQGAQLAKSLKVSEGPNSVFAVSISSKSQNIKKTDAPVTLIYIKARRIQDRVRQDIKILQDYSPWTIDTLPFWPDKKQALIIQRKVDKKIVDRIAKLRQDSSKEVKNKLIKLGQKDTNSAISRKTIDFRKAKAIPDVAFQMLTMEFGGGSQRGMHMWRNALNELIPGKIKNIAERYKKIKLAMSDSRDNTWRSWPRVNDKIKSMELKSFIKFQKQLGY